MPIHDWTRVAAGTFHDFHAAWIVHLKEQFNDGLLPRGFYAQAEQRSHDVWPDVLTLESHSDPIAERGNDPLAGAIAVAERPPKVEWSAASDAAYYLERQRSLVIRHTSGDRIIAIVEIVSSANKATRAALKSFLDKAVASLQHRYHLLVIDLYPPGSHDPSGIHGALWSEIGETAYDPPGSSARTLAAYASAETITAYVQPVWVGQELPDMPLFLRADRYVNAPLEQIYQAAWRGVPERWRRVIETDA